MNREWVLHHLSDASEELLRTIDEIRRSEDYDVGESSVVAMAHLYHHLNTAWNSRDASADRVGSVSDQDFKNWSAFPRDILTFE
jgi:hypothetical protein